MTMSDRRSMIRRYFDTYKTADRTALDALLSDDFTFTSPDDDHIDRAAYFERCWSKAGTFTRHDLTLVLVDGDDAVVHYDGESSDGVGFRNIERFHFAGDRIRAVEVFFGLPAGADAQAPEIAIRTVLEQRKEALKAKDARLVAAKHAPDTIAFSLAPPLVAVGESEATVADWFKTWQGLLDWETVDTNIAVSGDVAFVSALEYMAGTKMDGQDTRMWFRTTLGLRKLDGSWKITHEHQSVPFYMDGSLRAAVDLQPVTPATAADRELFARGGSAFMLQ